ncbi:MAG TPA: transglutaminase family protein [Candidatus Dormibacteraeota bacterium]
MRLSVTHLTRFLHSSGVSEEHMELRLRPPDGRGQRVISHHLDVRPESPVRSYVDGFGNHVQYFNLMPPHQMLEIVSRAQVETGLPSFPEAAELVPSDLLAFRPPVVDAPAVQRLARRARLREARSPVDTLQALDRILAAIARELTYTTDVTTVSTNVEEVLELRRGVCQDFAHVFIAVSRAAGIPCRYVSGYVYAGSGELVVGASHAWAEAWVPSRGWTAYDPTHAHLTPDHYVRLAVGRDYRDAAPTRGVFVGTAQSVMEASVEIGVADLTAA